MIQKMLLKYGYGRWGVKSKKGSFANILLQYPALINGHALVRHMSDSNVIRQNTFLYQSTPVSQWSDDQSVCTTQELVHVMEIYIRDGHQTFVFLFFEVKSRLFQPLEISRRTNVHPYLEVVKVINI